MLEASELSRINIELESKITNLTRTRMSETNAEIEELRRKVYQLTEETNKIPEFESRIILLSQELERLNNNLRIKVDENTNLENRFRTLQSQFNES